MSYWYTAVWIKPGKKFGSIWFWTKWTLMSRNVDEGAGSKRSCSLLGTLGPCATIVLTYLQMGKPDILNVWIDAEWLRRLYCRPGNISIQNVFIYSTSIQQIANLVILLFKMSLSAVWVYNIYTICWDKSDDTLTHWDPSHVHRRDQCWCWSASPCHSFTIHGQCSWRPPNSLPISEFLSSGN